ncbi:MAG: folylpolyglutamate synthase/dihydrofolate synthase family protein [Bdellovibrionales bacterium]|jgi:dihydrofolate synthase/folylpolyglutamate synthase
MVLSSTTRLERFRITHGKDIDLGLRSPYIDLLAAFGSPEKSLPHPILIAGTNGKGSTCAFLRAMIETAGKCAHVYTSPHLVRFHERVRIAGSLISEEELSSVLAEIEDKAEEGGLSLFEAATAAALIAFSRHTADVSLLEVGLGGRLDATNIVPAPKASLITRLSFDHREYLGNTMAEIAREKAGIMRPHTPCFVAKQPSAEAQQALEAHAAQLQTPLLMGGRDWHVEVEDEDHFRFVSEARTVCHLPRPALLGDHQLENAGLAIACAVQALSFAVDDDAIRQAMLGVEWQGRLQRLTEGTLVDCLKRDEELWLDGGHNDSAGEVLAAQIEKWQHTDGKPIDLILGMLATKHPEEFLKPLLPFIRRIRTLTVEGETQAHSAKALADHGMRLGVKDCCEEISLKKSLASLSSLNNTPSRTMICGSFYLVGQAMRENDLHQQNI